MKSLSYHLQWRALSRGTALSTAAVSRGAGIAQYWFSLSAHAAMSQSRLFQWHLDAANSMLAAAVVSTRIGATRLFAFIGPVLQLARRSQQSYARAQQFEISVFQSAVFLG